jgi:hypothetical protein
MPERVTREERTISLAIEKARSAKEKLLLSLENNRNPLEKDNIMEKVKLTRPKAENYNKKKYEGKHTGFGLGQEATGGDITEFKKSLDVIKYTIRGEGGVKADKQQIRDIELLIRQVEKDLDGLLDGLKDGSIGQEEFTEKSRELMREFNQEGILSKPNKYR